MKMVYIIKKRDCIYSAGVYKHKEKIFTQIFQK